LELRRRPWLGNIRELRNVIEYAMIHARSGVILPEHLPPPLQALPGRANSPSIADSIKVWAREQWHGADEPTDVYRRLLEIVEPPLLEVALSEHSGQCAAAARVLGLHRVTVKKKADTYGLPTFSSGSDN
jgi:two-component system nitrogen regulation response regulator GlnG